MNVLNFPMFDNGKQICKQKWQCTQGSKWFGEGHNMLRPKAQMALENAGSFHYLDV